MHEFFIFRSREFLQAPPPATRPLPLQNFPHPSSPGHHPSSPHPCPSNRFPSQSWPLLLPIVAASPPFLPPPPSLPKKRVRRISTRVRGVSTRVRGIFTEMRMQFRRDAHQISPKPNSLEKSLQKRQPPRAARFYKVKIQRNFQPAKCHLHSFTFPFLATFRPFHRGPAPRAATSVAQIRTSNPQSRLPVTPSRNLTS